MCGGACIALGAAAIGALPGLIGLFTE